MDDKERSRERTRRERPSRFSEASRDRSSDRGGRGDSRSMKSSNNRVYVSNIPYEYRWQDMKDLFRSQVGDVLFVELFVDDHDKPKGCGIVEFADSNSVKKCLEVMQRYEVKTRKLVVRDDSGTTRDKHGNTVGSSNSRRSRDDSRYRDERDRYDSLSGHGHSSSSLHMGRSERSGGADDVVASVASAAKWGQTYGLSPHFLESLGIDAPLCTRVFVANLEYNVDKKKLKEVFRLAGKVQKVEIPVDKDGRSRGFAVVEFDHPVEAVQAISMFHNQVLYDRSMTVRMDRATNDLKLPDGLKSIGMGLGTNGEPLKNVAQNLPSAMSNNGGGDGVASAGQAVSAQGSGLLGAMPNSALQMASAALSSLGGTSVLSGLLGNADLSSLTTSQVTSLLQAQGAGANTANSGNGLAQSYSRENNYSTGANPSGNGGYSQGFNQDRSFGSFDSPKMSSGYGTGGGGSGSVGNAGGSSFGDSLGGGLASIGGGGVLGSLGSLGNNSIGYSSAGTLLRSPAQLKSEPGQGFSRKVLISNLPPTASYKMMYNKLNEYGLLKYLEEKNEGTLLAIYAAEWQAEKACKNLDRARIDGCVIDARLHY